MKTPLSLLNLWHTRSRSAIAMAGVAFAAVLVIMQLGFLGALESSANRVYDQLDFDLLMSARSYRIFSRAGMFPVERLAMAHGAPEVLQASPFYIGLNAWLNDKANPPLRRGILVMSFRPGDHLFRLPGVLQHEQELALRGRLLMDQASRPEFGERKTKTESEIGMTHVQISGQYLLGSDFSADGSVITGDETFFELFPWFPTTSASLGLIKLRPGADAAAVAARLQTMLPEDVMIRTRQQTLVDEEYFWRTKTSVGTIFLLGVLIAALVGTGIVYQVMSSDVGNRLPEFATLKAMGYTTNYLTMSVVGQAMVLAIGGFIPAAIISWCLYEFTERQAHLPMDLTPTIAGSVFALSLAMCMISAVLALRKVATADPADLF
ncbi:MAG: FtsX-like permease family protein [Planctomycetaceae bacterium]|nr:FtsX-like permease family protein [Planctomycetaceae bacterium]